MEAVSRDTFQDDVVAASHAQPVLVDFWGPRCGPCLKMMPWVESLASDRFEVAYVCLEQIDLACLSCQQDLLFVHLLLKIVDFRAALHQFLIRRHKQADDDKPDGDNKQDQKNSVQSLPDCGFATRAEISVTVLHFRRL